MGGGGVRKKIAYHKKRGGQQGVIPDSLEETPILRSPQGFKTYTIEAMGEQVVEQEVFNEQTFHKNALKK